MLLGCRSGLCAWDLSSASRAGHAKAAHGGHVTEVRWAAGVLLSGGQDGAVRAWDPRASMRAPAASAGGAHAYHALKHQVKHRATEKAGMSIAERCVEFLAEAMVRFAPELFDGAAAQASAGAPVASRAWFGAVQGPLCL